MSVGVVHEEVILFREDAQRHLLVAGLRIAAASLTPSTRRTIISVTPIMILAGSVPRRPVGPG
jgi:hypothetical protein